MQRKSGVNIFSATNALKVLSFLADNPGKELLGSDIQKATCLSRAGVYIALRELIKQKLVFKTKRGKFLLYSVAQDDPVVRQFKIINNILFLTSLISRLKPLSKKIILYGSASRGEDDQKSDIDLFILAKDPQAVKKLLSSLKTKRKIQAVIKSPSELADLKEKDVTFYNEVDRGITLWEEKE